MATDVDDAVDRIEVTYLGDEDETATTDDQQAPDEEEAALRERVERVVEHIRAESTAERLVDPAVFAEEPFSFTDEQLAAVWAAVEQDDRYADIVRTADERSGAGYLHSVTFLSVAFAKLTLRKQADDPKYMIASLVRENSEIFPKPTSVEFFWTDFFGMEPDDVRTTVEELLADPAYADIKPVTTSNDVMYLYSERYLEGPNAQRMAEWVEVDSKDMYAQ